MNDEEMYEILQSITQLAHALGWETAGAQGKDGVLTGLYIGLPEWIETKVGKAPSITH